MLRIRSLVSLPVAALVVSAATLGAQGGGRGGFISASAAPRTAAPHRDVPLVAAKALIGAHYANVLDGTAEEPMILTMILDEGLNYVNSSLSKPVNVVRAADGSGIAAAGGFVSASGGSISASGGGGRVGGSGGSGGVITATATPAGSGSGAVAASAGGGGGGGGGAVASMSPTAQVSFGGMGPFEASQIAETFTISYEAGDIGPKAVRVRYVILKK